MDLSIDFSSGWPFLSIESEPYYHLFESAGVKIEEL